MPLCSKTLRTKIGVITSSFAENSMYPNLDPFSDGATRESTSLWLYIKFDNSFHKLNLARPINGLNEDVWRENVEVGGRVKLGKSLLRLT